MLASNSNETGQIGDMLGDIERFRTKLYSELLPSFCNARAENIRPEGFVEESISQLSEFDARWFLRAIDAGFVVEEDGLFTSPASSVKEQIFWEGKKVEHARRIFLWIEPVITIGANARLTDEFGWPPYRIGMQSQYPWPFDLMCYEEDGRTEIVACEVKKHLREIERLIFEMQFFSGEEVLKEEPKDSTRRNAYRKVVGIRKSWPRFFWALGARGNGFLFEVNRQNAAQHFELKPISERALCFDKF